MSLTIGIVGLPNVGKSTLFNALTKKSVLVANYPFATIDPSVGVVAVPDDRLWKLSEFSNSKKTVPAAIEFVDIAGLVKGASEGEGLGNKFLTNIRETDAIAEVVRIFEDGDIIHVNNKVEPLKDIEVINLELGLADLQTVTKRIANIAKDVKAGKKDAITEDGMLKRVLKALEDGKLASSVAVNEFEAPFLKMIHLLSTKPILYVLNRKSGGKNLDEYAPTSVQNGVGAPTESVGDERYIKLMEFFKANNSKWLVVDAGVEQDLKDLEGKEKNDFRGELGLKDDGIDNLIKKGYELLNLITYFTTGEDESRAWTIGKGWTAPLAGTAIHTDFKDKFVRAEVIEWDKLIGSGSLATAREKGLLRTEGKEYIVKDGDVIEFKI